MKEEPSLAYLTHRRRRLQRAVEEGKEVEDQHERRGREDYEELDRLLVEAYKSLEGGDLRTADEALRKAGVKATSMWSGAGRAALPGYTGKLVGLLWEVREDLSRTRGNHPFLRKNLRELRSRFELEARRDAGKTTAGGRSPRRGEAGRVQPSSREAR